MERGGLISTGIEEDFVGAIMAGADAFEKYLTTASFLSERDAKATYQFYEKDYGPFLPAHKDAFVLDIGCGMGEFITFMTSKGYANVSGVDVSREMVEHCNAHGIASVQRIDDLNSYLAQNTGKFDLITLNDVLEHIPKADTVSMLKSMRSALKKNGVLLVRTLNFSTLGGIYVRYKDFTHEIGYTEYSLRQVLMLAGFDNINIFGNKYFVSLRPRSAIRFVLLGIWFFILKTIYAIEVGEDRPRIYSKILIAACKV